MASFGPISGNAISDFGSSNAAALAVTLAAATLVATGVTEIDASLSVTLDHATLVSTGETDNSGTESSTLGDVTLSATATLDISGSLSVTLGTVILTAAGSSALDPISTTCVVLGLGEASVTVASLSVVCTVTDGAADIRVTDSSANVGVNYEC